MAINKRPPVYVPVDIWPALDCLSKADLMEAVWDYALFSVGDSAEDATQNPARLVDIFSRIENVAGLTATLKHARRVAARRGLR
jgi:hypothetical protein